MIAMINNNEQLILNCIAEINCKLKVFKNASLCANCRKSL